MILVEGEKYACERCIRGHRSSTCSHIKRPLVLVRARGRPFNTTQRIAILAEEFEKDSEGNYVKKQEIANSDDSNDVEEEEMKVKIESENGSSVQEFGKQSKSCCGSRNNSCESRSSLSSVPASKSSCCPSKSLSSGSGTKQAPVIMLKASKRQVFNVAKGPLKLLQPVSDIPNNEVGLEMIKKMAKKRESKHGKSCCSKKSLPSRPNDSSGKQNVKLSVINNLIRENSPFNNNFTMNNNTSPSTTSQGSSTENLQRLSNNLATGSPLLYDMYVADSCTVPGSCCCDDDACSCVGCIVHNVPHTRSQSTDSNQLPTANHTNKTNGQFAPLNYSTQPQTTPIHTSVNGNPNEAQNMLLFGQIQMIQMQSFVSLVPRDQHFQQSYQQQNPSIQEYASHLEPVSNSGSQFSEDGSRTVYPMLSAQNVNPSIDAFFNENNISNSKDNVNSQVYNPFLSLDSTPISESSSPSLTATSECQCSDDECACYFCEKHGIYKGVRLSDGVIVNLGDLESSIASTNATIPQQDIDIDSAISLRQNDLNERMVKMDIQNNSTNILPMPTLQGSNSTNYNANIPKSNSCCGNSINVGGKTETKVEIEPNEPGKMYNNTPIMPMNDIQASANAFLDSLDLSEFQDYCCCPDDACNCTNCFKHNRFGDVTITND